MSEWISVKDRLPINNESIGYTFDGHTIRKDVIFDSRLNRWFSVNSLDYEINEHITYWMPLPSTEGLE